ncbi:hypothetical protein [Methylococcus mesophilus]|uniref:hypothetical protein n=1 Tax=Methylococcus mesophilus TaxID=2993564 RepID=UPI00224AE254|nr:hypothetical protein [Methylococcus mesophilus]UZR29468.1 hypothetical protein OOT43_02205 [Methylococcus mesophilus]
MSMGGGGADAGTEQFQLNAADKVLRDQAFQDLNTWSGRYQPIEQKLAKMARGGLMGDGMKQVELGLKDALAAQPAMLQRQDERFGLTLTPEQQAYRARHLGLSNAATTVAVKNASRLGLANAMAGMAFGSPSGVSQ